MVTFPVIKLQKPKSRFQKVLEFQPKLTPFLAGTLGTLLGGPGTGAKVFIGTGLGVGILQVSPLARKVVKEKILDPTKIGRGIGEILEDPAKLLPKEKQPIRERVKEVVKKAGVAAGLVAAGVGVVAAAPIIAKKVKEKILPSRIPTELAPAALLPAAPTSTIMPFAAVEPTPTPKEVIPVAAPMPAAIPSIRNVFKPSIDIRFSKSRKFINQQINIRS